MNRFIVHFLFAVLCAISNQLSAQGIIDLELSALATNPTPAPFILTSAKFTLINKGTAAAQNVKVKINLPASGMILKGGDEYSSSQGSFEPYGNQVWTLGELEAGASAVLNLNFFNLNIAQKILFAQVLEATGPGDDSSPGNGICCTPLEDDEAVTSFNGIPVGSADLSLQLQWNGPSINSGPTNFTLKISNTGPTTATGVVVKVDGVAIGHVVEILATSQGVFNSGNREWLVGSLPAGATATLNYNEFLVDFEGYGPAYAFAQVQVSNQYDPNSTPGNKAIGTKIPTENDEAAVLVYPIGNAVFHDLSMTMSANRSTALPGDEVEILLKVNNSASFTVGGVTAQVLLPSGFQLLAALPSEGNFDAATGLWNIGYVERPSFPGAEKSLLLRVKINNIGPPKTVYAQIMTSIGFNDPDSQVGNGTCCTAFEDDEASVTIAPANYVGCTNNLLSNPGFEDGLAPWFNVGATEITTDAKTGSKAVKICDLSDGGLVQTLAAHPGESYSLLGWAKRDNSPNGGGGMSLWIKFQSDSWQPIAIQSVQINANAYTAYTLDAIAPAGTAWVEVGIHKFNGMGCIFADDLCLTKTGTGSGRPDLAFELSKPKFTPESIVTNEPFRVTLPFVNMGTALTGDFQVGLYVSPNNVLDNNAVLLGSSQNVPIQAGTSLTAFFEASIPASFPTGNAYFIVKLDNLDQNIESDEGNNVYTVPVNVLSFGQANVKIEYTGNEGNALAGGSFSLDDYRVFCDGVRAMPGHVQRVYLSSDNTLSADDVVLHSYNAAVLPVCGNSDFACSFFSLGDILIPANTIPGLYFVLIKLDADNAVAEISETDNVGFATLTVGGSVSSYCDASGDFPWEDWISGVKVNDVSRTSGKSPYSNFTPVVFQAMIGAANVIELTSSWSYLTYDENWAVWIDFNHDQIFQSSEKVFEGQTARPSDGTVSKTLIGNFNLPADALPGNTRMRVVMSRGGSLEPCGIFPFGEVEDYTVNIAPALQGEDNSEKTAANVEPLFDFTLFPNPAQEIITLDLSAWYDRSARLELYNTLGIMVGTWRFDKITEELMSINLGKIQNGQYLLRCVSPGVLPVAKKVVVQRSY